MDPLSVILAIIAGSLFAFGRGSLFSEFFDVSEPEQPHSTQIVILVVIAALIIIIILRHNKLGYTESQYIPVFVIMGISALIVWLIFRHTGPGGEPVMVVTRTEGIDIPSDSDATVEKTPVVLHDEKLNSFIRKGNYIQARKYLNEMLQMSKEMGDTEGQRIYRSYESIITKAAMEDKRGWKTGHR